MKALKIPGITLLFGLVATTSLLAQRDTLTTGQKPAAPAQASYYEQPAAPASLADLRLKKSGQGEGYLNLNQLPARTLLSLMNNSAADRAAARQKAEHKTFDISLYRVQHSMTVCLSVEKEAGNKTIIRLLNQRGEALHTEVVGRLAQKYSRRFDLSGVADGVYTIEVRNGQEVMHRSVSLTTEVPAPRPDRLLTAVN